MPPLSRKRYVISVGINGNYPKGVDRLSASLDKQGFKGEKLFWKDCVPPNSPPHPEVPRGFKITAWEEAEKQGAQIILWCDATVWFIKPPHPVFQRIEKDGYYFFQWINDLSTLCDEHGLKAMGITRAEAKKVPTILAGFWGLDLASNIGRQVMDYMKAAVRNGSFGKNPQVGSDEGPLSLIVRRLGLRMDAMPSVFEARKWTPRMLKERRLKEEDAPGWFAPWNQETKSTIALFCGL